MLLLLCVIISVVVRIHYYSLDWKSFLSLSALSTFRSASAIFSVEWINHKVALKANNGKYVCTKKNGQLLAVSDSPGMTQPGMDVALLFGPFLHINIDPFLRQATMNCSL